MLVFVFVSIYLLLIYHQYLFPLITLWTVELVFLIIFPGVKALFMSAIDTILQESLSKYR